MLIKKQQQKFLTGLAAFTPVSGCEVCSYFFPENGPAPSKFKEWFLSSRTEKCPKCSAGCFRVFFEEGTVLDKVPEGYSCLTDKALMERYIKRREQAMYNVPVIPDEELEEIVSKPVKKKVTSSRRISSGEKEVEFDPSKTVQRKLKFNL